MAPASAFSDVSDRVYIKGNQVRLRTAPTTADASNIYTVLNNGAALTRTGDSDDWCRVNYQGQTLYVSKTYVSSEPTASSGIQSGAAGISSGTGTVNASKTEVSDGSLITVDAGWLYADYSAIKTGAAVMYRSSAADRKEITVCVNAGHGTSGGEQAKVRLCKLINKETNVLMLDEPTNHLDTDAKEALKQALNEYRGTLLLICHEPEFYRDIVHEVWDCSKWTTRMV